jgi:hypothetical protein
MTPPVPTDRLPSRIIALSLYALLSLSATAQAQDQPAASPTPTQQLAPTAPSAGQSSSPAPANPTTGDQVPSNPAPAGNSNAAPATPQAAPAPSPQAAPGAVETPAVVVEGTTDTILGKPVVSASGDDMGRIVDVMVDHKGMVRAAVIDFGGFLGVGTRKIAVDWRALHFPKSGAMDKVVAQLSQDQLRAAPAYKPGEPVVIIGSTDAAPQPNPANPANPATPAAAATDTTPAPPTPAVPPPAIPAPSTPSPSTPSPSTPAPSTPAPSVPAPSVPAPATSIPTPTPGNAAPSQGNSPTQAP